MSPKGTLGQHWRPRPANQMQGLGLGSQSAPSVPCRDCRPVHAAALELQRQATQVMLIAAEDVACRVAPKSIPCRTLAKTSNKRHRAEPVEQSYA